jgi:serine/threonine protein kinase
MDYCDGKPLDKYVDEGTGVSPRRIFQIYTALINALEHVHQQGIIHGDLKPSNIMVRSDGIPVLLDFGSARQEMLRIAVGQVSDGYSPPEFYGSSVKVGPWSDIYGLAATFYRLITGVKVSVATDRTSLDSYISATTLVTEGYSTKFLELIDNSLKLPTSERPQSIASLRRLLPGSESFSNRPKADKDLRVEQLLEHASSSTFNWKPLAIALGIIILFWGGFAALNRTTEESRETESAPKVSPIQIEESPLVAESPATSSRSFSPKPVANPDFQQALTYLAKVSTSSEISWHSIPQTEQAVRSLRYVMSEIKKQLISADERKEMTYNKNTDELLIRNFSIGDIKMLGFTATDVKCNMSPIGPAVASCRKYGKDFKCQYIDLPVKYENTCLSAFSLQ